LAEEEAGEVKLFGGGLERLRLRGRRPRGGGEEVEEERSNALLIDGEGEARVRGRRARLVGVAAGGAGGGDELAGASVAREEEGADRGKLNVLNLCFSSKGVAVSVSGGETKGSEGGSDEGEAIEMGGGDGFAPNEKVFIRSTPSRKGGGGLLKELTSSTASVEDRARGLEAKAEEEDGCCKSEREEDDAMRGLEKEKVWKRRFSSSADLVERAGE
jgi:hypothetical protein